MIQRDFKHRYAWAARIFVLAILTFLVMQIRLIEKQRKGTLVNLLGVLDVIEKLISAKEVAEILGLSEKTIGQGSARQGKAR